MGSRTTSLRRQLLWTVLDLGASQQQMVGVGDGALSPAAGLSPPDLALCDFEPQPVLPKLAALSDHRILWKVC